MFSKLHNISNLSKLCKVNSNNIFCKKNYRVVVLGASSDIGCQLSLLLKQNPLVSTLALYDENDDITGLSRDLSFINTKCAVESFLGFHQLTWALFGAHLILFAAGQPPKLDDDKDIYFNDNAEIARILTTAVARNCPTAILAILTGPIDSIVPVVSATMMKHEKYDPQKILGVNTLNAIRSANFLAQLNYSNPQKQYVPVVGGSSEKTIVPLLSQADPPVFLTEALTKNIMKKIRTADTAVTKAKHAGVSKGSVTLSMAYAASCFANSVLRALAGERDVTECAYVKSDFGPAPYFASPILLDDKGLCCNFEVHKKANQYEKDLLDAALPLLKQNIEAGESYVKQSECI